MFDIEERADRVEVRADGEPFTAYLHDGPDVLRKPVLYPVRTARGTPVTRGWPLDPRPGERTDHPHHIGYWLNYGSVGGADFWGNAGEHNPEQENPGTIEHTGVERTAGGESGELSVTADWNGPDGETLLRERTTFRFRGGAGSRVVDRQTLLEATDAPVKFPDDKEGMLALRVRPELELPIEEEEMWQDAAGEDVVGGERVERTGDYDSAEAGTGREVWGTRARWMTLAGDVDGERISLTLMDHPDNPGAPTYWHARGYGLFAANPFGQAVFSEGAERLGFALDAGESATFRYRLRVDDDDPDREDLLSRYGDWTGRGR